MVTVSHIAQRLSTTPRGPSQAAADLSNYCLYCGCLIADIDRLTLHEPRTCPIDLLGAHGWRPCWECSGIAAAIWYYLGNGQTRMPQPVIRGASLDVYVWIVRRSQEEWTVVQVPYLAAALRYSRSAIAGALRRLRLLGILEKRPRAGLYGQYRPLIWQLPMGG
jgi:hypothetical protein